MHPSFKNPTRELSAPDWSFTAKGWGTFEVQVEIRFDSGAVVQHTHMLQFDTEEFIGQRFELPGSHAGIQGSLDNDLERIERSYPERERDHWGANGVPTPRTARREIQRIREAEDRGENTGWSGEPNEPDDYGLFGGGVADDY